MIGASESIATDAYELLGVPSERIAVISIPGVDGDFPTRTETGHLTPDLHEVFGFPVLESLALRDCDVASLSDAGAIAAGDAGAPDDHGLHTRVREEGPRWSRFF
jgi:hypothetical protein